MEEPTGKGTVAELFQALYEMGFGESQAQAAFTAGCFRVQEAVEWILNGRQHRGTLQSHPEADLGAIMAFNPPKSEGGLRDLCPSDATVSLERESQPLVMSRHTLRWREYDTKQSASLAQNMKETKRNKEKERDLVLQRIAEDRRSQQEKGRMVTPQKCLKSESPCVGKPHNSCALMVRLPCGRSVHLALAADSPLQKVYEHVQLVEPSLGPCSLRSSYPARHFSDVDLSRSLDELGLTPNATLCVCPRQNPPAVQEANSNAEGPSVSAPLNMPPEPQDLIAEGGVVRAALTAPAQSVTLNVHLREGPLPRPLHNWGPGRTLLLQEQEAAGNEQHQIEGVNDGDDAHRQPPGNAHLWPEHGRRLQDSNRGGCPTDALPSPEAPLLVMARAAAELRQGNSERSPAISETRREARAAAELRQGNSERPPTISERVQAPPSLRHFSLQAVLHLIAAPSMQYSRSFSRVTPEIVELIIDHMIKERALRPRTLELFGGCPIRQISLKCYQYCTNELIRHLQHFPSLKSLNLSSCSLLTDQGLRVMKHLHKLQYLNLGACPKLTDSCLLHLLGQKHLSQLILDQTKVSDEGLCSFLLQAQCSLTYLSVNRTAVSESSLSVLSQRMAEVRVVSVKHNQISDVSSLVALKHLHTLHLDHTQVSQHSLMMVTSLPALSTLTLSGVVSLNSDKVLEGLSGLSLTRVVLPGRRCLSDFGLSYLSGLRSLIELDLTDHTQITDQGVQYISALDMLRTLSLCNTSVSDSGLLHLRGLRNLENLSLDRTKVTSRGVSRCIPHLPHLQVLGLSDTNVGDNVLKHGIRHCRHLVKVNLSRTRITNKGLRFLKQVSVTQLSLDGSGITPQALSELMSVCVSLTSVRANNLRAIPAEEISDDDEEPPMQH
ncbi:hypothetical protein XENTR_v10015383 [Xenopus tropicalis]|nr:hypothetical protein XENTR_v10015383 [Xenopus tropicalis]KAE8594931.1 hypothetical protein XENTR_v10015383 [Xenopus tropicalis]KAE8594932.1 hypothetical protein XENTR_v10015383 [Xenopus tropicalis]